MIVPPRRSRLAAAVVSFSLAVLAAAVPGSAQERVARPPLDPTIEARIDDLMGRMTLEDKVGQMYMGSWPERLDLSEIENGSVGAVANCSDAGVIAMLQAKARTSRLGIPLLTARDVIHGYRTLFPVPIGLAASFDRSVWRDAALWTARESHEQGLDLALGPMVDVSRDTRWGRVVEGPGEDPFLASAFAEESVKGLAAGGLGSALKHFVGYGAVRAGRDYAEADFSTPTLHDVYLPPFRAGLAAGAQVVMAAFNAVGGVPATANRRLLTDLLKRDMGFDGFVLSDWDAIHELFAHGLGADEDTVVERAVTAGLDMEMAGRLYPRRLPGLVRSGRVPVARIDDAVRRILRVKFRLGLMDRTAPKVAALDGAAVAVDGHTLASPEIRAAALDAAHKSVVLLKNERDLLPLMRPPKRIAVIGRGAVDASDHMGAWGAVALQSDTPTFYATLKHRLAPRGVAVTYTEGCDDDCAEPDPADFRAAVAAAQASDLVIAVLGEPWYMTAESTSRTRIGLPNHQQALLDRLAATGKPVVLIAFAGRSMALTEAMPKAKAVFLAYSPGTMAGPALVDLLLGDATPSARLPMSMPRSVGQLPLSYDVLPTGRPGPHDPDDDLWSRYLDEDNAPLFPFGFGLSYTTFAYSDLRLSATRVGPGDELVADVAVTDTGRRAGREIVQLYVHQPVASRSRPVAQLEGFAVVDLKPGETRRVVIPLAVGGLAFHDDDGRPVIEPGRIDVRVGGSSAATLTASFEIEPR